VRRAARRRVRLLERETEIEKISLNLVLTDANSVFNYFVVPFLATRT